MQKSKLFQTLIFTKPKSLSKLRGFNCGDTDLNEFFLKDSFDYAEQLLGVTYVFELNGEVIAFFTVLNDKIINMDEKGKFITNTLPRRIPNSKRRPTYPAVKVGRLGIHNEYKRAGLGSDILTFIKHFFTDSNKTGCRFITIDAYNKQDVLDFYKKNDFKFLTDKDDGEETRLMWFDLMQFKR